MKPKTAMYVKVAMYVILTILALYFVIKVSKNAKDDIDTLETETISESRDIEIKEIDGCEYVIYYNYEQGGICHKGNCKNHNYE